MTFPSPTGNPLYSRTYRRDRETWKSTTERCVAGLKELGLLTDEEIELIRSEQNNYRAMVSGRWLWVGGTDWVSKPENYTGGYNCSSMRIDSFDRMGYAMNLLMQGCGVGTVLTQDCISQLPQITTHINSLKIIGEPGDIQKMGFAPIDKTIVKGNHIFVGDSRQGWCDAYLAVLEASASGVEAIDLEIELTHIRPQGTEIKGFGGKANPVGLPSLFERMVGILNKAIGRKLNSVEVCLLLDWAAMAVVAGNIRRCIAYGEKVLTPDGEKAIEDIKVGDRVKGSSGLFRSVTAVFNQGIQEVIELRTDKGLTIKCTPNHRIAVVEGDKYVWKYAAEIDSRDRVLVDRIGRNDSLLLSDPEERTPFSRLYSVQKVFKKPRAIGIANTIDIEVEIDNCFYCNGILVHNSANMRQFDRTDTLAANVKQNLWQTDERGNWYIDPELDALRMGNHTRIFFTKPTLENCIDSVRAQYKSGEGAIMWAGEAVARANADLLYTQHLKQNFLMCYERDIDQAKQYLSLLTDEPMSDRELEHRIDRYGVNPCGEILQSDNFCNLSDVHLNQLDPTDFEAQKWAFTAAGLSAAVLLHHKFDDERMQYSREIDPIVGVSFTGLFDFFVNAFGVDWLKWWQAGRPKSFCAHRGISIEIKQACLNFGIELDRYDGDSGWDLGSLYHDLERAYLSSWRHVVEETVWDYCDRAGLRHPNRCTTVQPSGSKSLLTGSSPGWHPPKAQRYIRRMTFGRDNPVALACIDYGYNVIPSQSDKDEHGNLLNDPFDPRCTEWLIEIPIEVPWANIPGVDSIEIEMFSALAQYDFWMQVQKYYTAHNTSSTIELREHEIEELGTRIYESIRDDEGYISSALLARFNYDRQIFPRLPFEPIDKETFDRLSAEVLARRKGDDFAELLDRYDSGRGQIASGPNACDSERCSFTLTVDVSFE